MTDITKLCTGCRACEQRCPTKSIKMEADLEGFLQASISQDSCIDCGLCVKICPQNQKDSKPECQEVWALTAKDRELLHKSASGGLFAALAKAFIEKGGWIAGCAFNKDIVAEHILTNKVEDIERIQSSKYVQSDTLNIFSEIQKLLKDGKSVLFSGTGCQVAGLKAFLRKDYPKLYTLDLICHGVPSPLLFEKYKQWWTEKKHGEVKEVNFRDKSRQGWGLGYKVKVKVKVKDYHSLAFLDPYYYHFLEGNTYRRCCYNCRYNDRNRLSDITMGDYWGLLNYHPKFYDLEGVSVGIVNTERGMKLLNDNMSAFKHIFSNFKYASKSNGNLIHPTTCNLLVRDHIYEGINQLSATEFFKNNFRIPFITRSKYWIKSLFPTKFKLQVKKIIREIKN